MPKIIVTGASGNLGRAMMTVLTRESGFEVLGWAHSRLKSDKLKKVDLLNEQEVIKALMEYQPDIIVHCAAERRPEVVESQKERSQALNISSTTLLARYSASNSIVMIHISTDYVFDGTNPPYAEDATPNPLNEYGRQKLASENTFKQTAGKNGIILRVPVLYGLPEYIGESAVDALISALLDRNKKAKMDDYAIRYPTHTLDVAEAVAFIIHKYLQNPSSTEGMYHWSSDKPMTKWHMVKVIAEALGLPYDHLEGDSGAPTGPVSRPKDAALSCNRLLQLGAVRKHRYLSECSRGLYAQLVQEEQKK